MAKPPCQAYASGMTPKELKKLRASTGLTQSQFAKALQISVRTLQNWEIGKHEIGSTAALYVAHMVKCKKLDVSKKEN